MILAARGRFAAPTACISFVAALCLAATLAGKARAQDTAPAKGDLVTLAVSGKLTPEVRAALDGLIEPDSVSRLIETISTVSAPLKDVCAGVRCTRPGSETMELSSAANAGSRTPHVNGLAIPTIARTELVVLPGIKKSGIKKNIRRISDEFAVVAGANPLAAAAGKANVDALAVPAKRLAEKNLVAKNGQIVIPPNSSRAAVSLIEKDVQIGGSSERQFRINRLLPEDEVARRVAVIQAAANTTLASAPPRDAFSFIQFQSTGAACTASPAGWPFDTARVAQVAKFNEAIRKRLRVGPARRARVLVVDTGLGKGALRNEAFARVLYADPAELIAPASAQRQFSGDPICVDGNNNGYWRDVYGAGAGPAISDENRCLDPSFDFIDLVKPHPRKEGSTQLYNPDHGTFVGALAAGGPALIAAFPDVANLVGLTFFRVTRRSDAPNQDVENSFSDIQRSLEYANGIGADVINMSLKTGRSEVFDLFRQNLTSLLIASAGNLMEDLDQRALENRPASLKNMDDRMIVVAALQRNDATPLWPQSARSSTRVHIAAPGVAITSFGADGQSLCDSGTSAAAPLVSFAAAMLRATTAAPREIVRSRLLAAADYVPGLEQLVEDARRLNIEAALDVFVDRVETDAGTKRGWIEPNGTRPLVRVCAADNAGLADLRGTIDLGLLWQWRKRADGKVSIRHQIEQLRFDHELCNPPSGAFSFYDLSTGTTSDINWSNVTKILPTPFRAVRPIILKSTSTGDERR